MEAQSRFLTKSRTRIYLIANFNTDENLLLHFRLSTSSCITWC